MENKQTSPSKGYPEGYRWLDDESFAKLVFRTRGHYARILSGLRKYGQDVYVDGAIEALMYITEQTWDIVRGKDKPIKPHPHFNRYDEDSYSADD